jgi:hypothetical protein
MGNQIAKGHRPLEVMRRRPSSVVKVGDIRLGRKVDVANRPGVTRPMETDYFVCPPEVEAVYGPEPIKLMVMFTSNEISESITRRFSLYGSNQRMKCYSWDGGDAQVESTRGFVSRPCPQGALVAGDIDLSEAVQRCPDICDGKGKQVCTDGMSIDVLLPEVIGKNPDAPVGTYRIRTRSYASMEGVLDGLDMAQKLTGNILGMKFWLTREPCKMRDPGDHSKTQTHYILRLAPVASSVREAIGYNVLEPAEATQFLESQASPTNTKPILPQSQQKAIEGPAETAKPPEKAKPAPKKANPGVKVVAEAIKFHSQKNSIPIEESMAIFHEMVGREFSLVLPSGANMLKGLEDSPDVLKEVLLAIEADGVGPWPKSLEAMMNPDLPNDEAELSGEPIEF